MFTLLHVKHFSDQLSSIVYKKYQLKPISFKTSYSFKLNRIIKLQKDTLKTENNTHLIYKINCKNCDKSYIGQTRRLVKTRCEEHRKIKFIKQTFIKQKSTTMLRSSDTRNYLISS